MQTVERSATSEMSILPVTDAPLDPLLLRGVLGTYPTGVAIVTARSPGGRPVGLTINSFASLSLAPPLVLWSLSSRSPNLAIFRDCEHFAINVLNTEQEQLARAFASAAVADKFAGVPIAESAEGLPVLLGALSTLVCSNAQQIEGGDHLLLLGRVLRAASTPGAPLVFHTGKFARLQGAA